MPDIWTSAMLGVYAEPNIRSTMLNVSGNEVTDVVRGGMFGVCGDALYGVKTGPELGEGDMGLTDARNLIVGTEVDGAELFLGRGSWQKMIAGHIRNHVDYKLKYNLAQIWPLL